MNYMLDTDHSTILIQGRGTEHAVLTARLNEVDEDEVYWQWSLFTSMSSEPMPA